MSRRAELITLLVVDALALYLANLLFYAARFEWGWFAEPVYLPGPLWPVLSALSFFWLAILFFFGMYQQRYASSRFDELISLVKVVTIGVLVLFFLLFIGQLDAHSARQTILFYWCAIFLVVAAGRIMVRSVQKLLIVRGYGLHNALVVGWTDRVANVFEDVPAAVRIEPF